MRQFSCALLILLLSHASHAISAGGMPCDQNGECSDPCAYFSDEATFVRTDGDTAKLRYKGKIRDLKLVSSKSLKKRQANAELPGDIERFEYAGKKIQVVLTQKVVSTTCYFKNEQGRYESEEKCCGTSYKLNLKITVPEGSELLETEWASGC